MSFEKWQLHGRFGPHKEYITPECFSRIFVFDLHGSTGNLYDKFRPLMNVPVQVFSFNFHRCAE